MEHVFEEIILDILQAEVATAQYPCTSAGTFALRQAAYFIRKGGLRTSSSQLQALAELIPENDPEAKRHMIAGHLRKVINIAKRYAGHGLAFLDLIREGMDGLIHAYRKFELEGGFRFSAYASQCIRHSIENAITSRIALPTELQAALTR